MVLAAIDIGSNGIRLQIIRVLKSNNQVSFKKLEYIRFPLRLGRDVFTVGQIHHDTIEKFEKLMRTFKLLVELYEVQGYIATATSAMREAKNGKEIVRQIATYFDLKIDIISGQVEAELLSKAIMPYLDEKNYIHIDVGGGSTELNIYVNKERMSSQSFKIGSVRQLDVKKRQKVLAEIEQWVKPEIKTLKGPVIAVGTGGNINKLFQLSHQKYNGSISLTELQGLNAYVSQFDFDQRVNMLKMNPDRADVILPASEIYIDVMKLAAADQVFVPGVGLKDGLVYSLYEKMTAEDLKEVQFVGTY